MSIQETFHGFIETTTDALLIFEACRQGILPKINRRLHERERGCVTSGTVFVFDEKESGIKRWTDGMVWSPSRILGNFLVYRELDGRESIQQETPVSEGDAEEYMTMEDRNRERALVGSLTDTYRFRKDGLIKKTISVYLNNSFQHLVSYYTKHDVLEKQLVTPCSIPDIGNIRITPELLLRQSFRVPPSVEYNECLSPSNSSSSSCCSTPPTKKNVFIDENNVSSTRRRTFETIEGYNNPLSRKIVRLSMDFNNNKNTFIEPHPLESNRFEEESSSAFRIVKQIDHAPFLPGQIEQKSFPFIGEMNRTEIASPVWTSPFERKYPDRNKLISAHDPCAVDQSKPSTKMYHSHLFQNNHHSFH